MSIDLAPEPQKVRVFIDFWNFQLMVNQVAPQGYRVDWKKFPLWLANQACLLVPGNLAQAARFEGAHVYLSYDPRSHGDRRLRNWATVTLDRFPGIQVICKERKSKGPPVCSSCHQQITECSHCGNRMIRTIEKGIDTAIVTDMIKLAWEEAWDISVLVSSDRDFIPAVEFLAAKGRKVINAGFPPKGADLARTCWAYLDLRSHLDDFQRK